MNQPVNVGVIGLGRSGWNIHALTIATHPLFHLAAVTDPEASRRQEAVDRFGCDAYASFEELIANPGVELVVVASPSHLHAPMSSAALAAGKHVLVEKPMAMSAAEADGMIETARRSGRLLTVFQIRRLDPDFLKIREILQSGQLGPIHEIRLAMHYYDRRADWQTLRRFGGGQLGNHGSHLIDQALVLAGGEWHEVFADLRRVAAAGDAEDHVKLVFRGRQGVVVDVEIGVSVYGVPHWLIMGRYGSLTGERDHLDWKFFEPEALDRPEASEGPAAGRRYGSGETLPWITRSADLSTNDRTPQFYDRLYASLREGAPLLVPPDETRTLMALFDACREASLNQEMETR